VTLAPRSDVKVGRFRPGCRPANIPSALEFGAHDLRESSISEVARIGRSGACASRSSALATSVSPDSHHEREGTDSYERGDEPKRQTTGIVCGQLHQHRSFIRLRVLHVDMVGAMHADGKPTRARSAVWAVLSHDSTL
jgi:hypothetical protein